MPVHDFIHAESGEIISVFVPIKEPVLSHQQQIVDGKIYKRIFGLPNLSKDVKIGSGTKDDFKRITQEKNLKVGEMFEKAKELSQARADKNGGIDPVKENYYKKYEKEIGQKHADIKKRESRKLLREKLGIRIED